MAPKRPLESGEPSSTAKKPKRGFRVGPDNLPDGPWRRKVTKIKKDLIQKAKVKKEYAKIKAREQQTCQSRHGKDHDEVGGGADSQGEADRLQEEAEEKMHPTRELMLKDEDKAQAGVDAATDSTSDGMRRRTRRPGYYDKQLQKAQERQEAYEEKTRERERRTEERERKMAERQRFKKAMAKTVGKDGKKKLGRESTLLLDKVKRMMEK
ncbi:hypothetical protein NOR_02043 [Metarhizium rileyi]|uniref:rRNA-processing protein FYV7 n=1 Tax=Metarhizium rileyi (strain RCEF 4871) TaxID=1649241 RepID=A0A167H6U5_METRR|nr:hypothetical protein NOR_02043 [Metarhizium rileyi RCEF 4871]TWU70724.1 hypothetical protein ED733_000875 [Metarhizium rileyi]